MHPKARKKKPEGTRITLRGKNVAHRKTTVIRGRQGSKAEKRAARARRINLKRKEKAIEKGHVKTVERQVVDKPAGTTTTPGSTKTVSIKKFTPTEVRSGSSKAFGRELPAGQKPKADPEGNRGQRLQAALKKGREEKKDIVVFEGKKFRAGFTTTESKTVTAPGTTTKTPATFKTVTKEIPQFKRKVAKKRKIKAGKSVQPVRGRVQRFKTTID